MKNISLILSLFFLTGCTSSLGGNMTDNSHETRETVEETTESSNIVEQDPMEKQIAEILEVINNKELVLPIEEIVMEELPEEEPLMCGNSTALEVYDAKNSDYQVSIGKELEDESLSFSMSFNQNKELITLHFSDNSTETIKKLLDYLDFPEFLELSVTELSSDEYISARYKMGQTYVSYKAALYPTFDSQGEVIDEGEPSYSLSVYLGFEMKPEYQLNEDPGVVSETPSDYREITP